MFKKVLGPWAGHVYSISVFFLLIGALSIFILMMGIQANDLIKQSFGQEHKRHFRELSIIFSIICGVSLFLRNLKVLSYVSIIKIIVMIFILIVAVSFSFYEYDRRRKSPPNSYIKLNEDDKKNYGTFFGEFPVFPTILGFMKAMGSWQTAYLFHMGVSDMYFSMENKSYLRWSKVSRISCLCIAILNICFALVGYFATADQLINDPHQDAKDLCAVNDLFLSLYDATNTNNMIQKIGIQASRYLIIFILMASYPIIFYFLKEYTLLIVKNLFPSFHQSVKFQFHLFFTDFGGFFVFFFFFLQTVI